MIDARVDNGVYREKGLAQVARIKVLIAEMPRMLSDIVTSLVQKQDDMELVDRAAAGGNKLLDVVERLRPNVVVLAAQGPELSPAASRLFRRFPGLRLVAVEKDGRSAYRYEMRPQRTEIEGVSPRGLLAALRGVVDEE